MTTATRTDGRCPCPSPQRLGRSWGGLAPPCAREVAPPPRCAVRPSPAAATPTGQRATPPPSVRSSGLGWRAQHATAIVNCYVHQHSCV
jgi:hypothetical protein